MYLQLLILILSATITLGQGCISEQKSVPCQLTRFPKSTDINEVKKVRVEIYYQAFCQLCRFVYAHHIMPVVKFLKKYVDVHTYPYIVASTEFGTINFECQHGPKECYASKLHVCAIEVLGNVTGVLFNACLMDENKGEYGSQDSTVSKCALQFSANPGTIINCAKSDKGALILYKYALQEADGRTVPTYVPYVLINGKEATKYGQKLFIDVCNILHRKPAECAEIDND